MAEPKSTPMMAAGRSKNDELIAQEEAAVAKALESGEETPVIPAETTPEPETPAVQTPPPQSQPPQQDLLQSDRGKSRQQDLANKVRENAIRAEQLAEENARLKRLVEQSKAPTAFDTAPVPEPQQTQISPLPWDKPTKTEEETETITEEMLDERVKKRVDQELEMNRLGELYRFDAVAAADKYAEFRVPTPENPNPEYDDRLVKDVIKTYKASIKEDPKTRLIDVVEGYMRLKHKGAEQAELNKAQVINKMDAEQAIDPSSTPQPTDDGDLVTKKVKGARTMKELEALEKELR